MQISTPCLPGKHDSTTTLSVRTVFLIIYDGIFHSTQKTGVMINSMMMAFSKSMINPRTTSGYTLATTHATSLRGVQQSEIDFFSAISLKKGSLSILMRKYKSVVLYKILAYLNPMFAWQARFYDHILRGESDLEDIRLYIAFNSVNWGKGDCSTLEEDPIYA